MSDILLVRFAKHLKRSELKFSSHEGPLFHRWLPDGERDAITVTDSKTNTIVKLWFERWGFVDSSMIMFDYNRKEVNPDIITRQAVLDAGPLYGNIRLSVSSDELNAVRQNRKGDSTYEALGKRLVKNIIYPQVLRFLNMFRINFGQYWIALPTDWDSRQCSLGHYCRHWNMKWSNDDGASWSDFIPNEEKISLTLRICGEQTWRELLHESDWREIQDLTQSGYEPSFAGTLITLAHELADQDKLRHAFIEGITALEVAIEEFYKQKFKNDETLRDALKSYWELPLRTRLASVTLAATSSGSVISSDDVLGALRAIEIRNRVVHEGVDPQVEDGKHLAALLRVASALLLGSHFRFPPSNIGNEIRRSEKEWEKD
ncbi:MAG: hypothetical protein HY964_06355 [Ignavibacteriales bacterium]|nr:hypothetical protein [Ignavibacteriales bacterium]